jgi:PiT family inorganic phosphate transporter
VVAAGTAAVLVVATVASLFMAWTIGAGSSGSTPFAPAVGARAISVMRAGFLVGILGLLGAILQGANVADAVGTGLVSGISLSPTASTVLLLLAAGLVAIGIFTGYPIATAFTVTGAVVGVGLGLGGSPVWPKYAEIGTLWLLTPFVGGGIAYITARTLRHEAIPERYSVPVLGGIVGLIVANVPFTLLGSGSGGASIAAAVATDLPVSTAIGTGLISMVVAGLVAGALVWDLDSGVDSAERHFLLALGGLVAFSAGGSQVGLAVGPLLAAFEGTTLPFSVSLLALLVFGGIGLLAGSWMGAPRMIKAIAQDYSSLGPRRSIAALIPSFAIAQTAVVFGIPVSFNEIIVSAVIGSGFAAGGGVSARKMGYTVLAWIGSLVLALGAGYAVISAIELL